VTLLVGWQEGHPACKMLDVGLLVVMAWLEFSHLTAPVVTTISIVLSSDIRIQNGDIPVPANPVHLEKWPLKHGERDSVWQISVVFVLMGDHKTFCVSSLVCVKGCRNFTKTVWTVYWIWCRMFASIFYLAAVHLLRRAASVVCTGYLLALYVCCGYDTCGFWLLELQLKFIYEWDF